VSLNLCFGKGLVIQVSKLLVQLQHNFVCRTLNFACDQVIIADGLERTNFEVQENLVVMSAVGLITFACNHCLL
jgi:hypothetical protein